MKNINIKAIKKTAEYRAWKKNGGRLFVSLAGNFGELVPEGNEFDYNPEELLELSDSTELAEAETSGRHPVLII